MAEILFFPQQAGLVGRQARAQSPEKRGERPLGLYMGLAICASLVLWAGVFAAVAQVPDLAQWAFAR
jgi:hypothetical protein